MRDAKKEGSSKCGDVARGLLTEKTGRNSTKTTITAAVSSYISFTHYKKPFTAKCKVHLISLRATAATESCHLSQ